MTIDWTKFTILVGPLVPDAYSIILEIFHIGVAGKKPQQLVDDALQMEFLGGEQWESVSHVESHLMSEDTLYTCTSTVALDSTFLENTVKQVEILFHLVIFELWVYDLLIFYWLAGYFGSVIIHL